MTILLVLEETMMLVLVLWRISAGVDDGVASFTRKRMWNVPAPCHLSPVLHTDQPTYDDHGEHRS